MDEQNAASEAAITVTTVTGSAHMHLCCGFFYQQERKSKPANTTRCFYDLTETLTL